MPEPAVRVLVVEDEQLYADQLEPMLWSMDYETVGLAASVQVALALYRTEPIDLVLLDIGLRCPTNGLQLAEQTCSLTLAERSIQVRMSLREQMSILPAERFAKIQRSYFVNAGHMERLTPTRLLVQVGRQLLPVGRLIPVGAYQPPAHHQLALGICRCYSG